MRINENCAIVGDNVVLVPYRAEHVVKYHQWMQSAEIREATASEPLSFEEEEAMQQSWLIDNDKLTFIVLDKQSSCFAANSDTAQIAEMDLTRGMAGDVNIFLSQDDAESPAHTQAELEIMIAEPSARRKGYAKEALQLMMAYAAREPLSIRPETFFARIGMQNTGSIRLFERLGFGITKRIEVFQEVELRPTDAGVATIRQLASTPLTIHHLPSTEVYRYMNTTTGII